MILIDMEMPESCLTCPLRYYCTISDSAHCGYMEFNVTHFKSRRHPNCSLKPQGTLICAEELIERINKRDYSVNADGERKDILFLIKHMVTEQKGGAG